mgnify:CR=1 FL=1
MNKKFLIIFIFFLSFLSTNAFAFITYKQSKVISSDTPGVRGINFKPDGTIMYVTGRRNVDGDTVIQYSLTTPFDISTATKTSETVLEIDGGNEIDKPHAIEFKPDGKVMYVIHSLTGYKSVEQFDLTTAWDTSTLSHNTRLSVSNSDVQLRALAFKPDGTRMYIGQTTYGKVLQYDLSTPWDVSSATNLVESDSYAGQENNIRNIQFSSDGTIMYLGGNGGDDINKYTLTTAWDVSTLEHSTSYSVSSETGNMMGFMFTANFTKLYVTADAGTVNTIFEYSVACAGTITCSDPSGNSDVKAIIEANVELSKRIMKYKTLPVFHRIEWLRRHKNKDNLSNLNAQIDFTNKKVSKLVKGLKSLKKDNSGNLNEEDWFDWSEGRISFGKGKSVTSSSKDIHSYGFSIGTDRINKEDKDTMYGYVFQYGNDNVDIGSNGTKLDTDSYSIARYSTKLRDNSTFADGIIGISLLDIHHHRVTYGNILKGNREGKQIFGSINLGKRLIDEKVNLNPSMKIDLGYTELAAFREKTTLGDSLADALIYKKQKVKSALATIGVLLDKTDKHNDKKIINHHGRLEYIADLSPSSDAEFYYVNSQSTIYKYTPDSKAKHNYRIGYGFDTTSISGWSIVTNFERFKANGRGHSNEFYLSFGYVPIDEFKFALHLNYNENLNTGINIVKSINGFDLKFNIDADIDNNNQNSNIFINKSY